MLATVDMTTREGVKTAVQQKYAEIARGSGETCCGPDDCCGTAEVTMIGDEYDGVAGYVAEADLKLGCGLPTGVAGIKPGHAVLDLGSGAGLDAFVARSLVGEGSRVAGVDMTPEMVEKAWANAEKLGFANVTFHLGDIEALPLEDGLFDVVISNCVLNLVPSKPAAFAEMYRVLKPGGHFCVSDIVTRGALPDSIRRSAELHAGCVAGALEEKAYLDLLRKAGFAGVEVVREKRIEVPRKVLLQHASRREVAAFEEEGGQVVSVTVRGVRAA